MILIEINFIITNGLTEILAPTRGPGSEIIIIIQWPLTIASSLRIPDSYAKTLKNIPVKKAMFTSFEDGPVILRSL